MPQYLTPAQELMAVKMGTLTPETYTNFSAIANKYPGISKDLVVAMTRAGLTANTPGINKITTIDGIAALKNEAFKVDKLKSNVKADRGILGSMDKTFREAVYNPIKGTLRTAFAGLRLPYDIATVATRNLTDGKSAITDFRNAFEATTFGSLLASGNKGTGSGFFISPETKVGKAQAKAMGKYGQINGESFTIGRSIFNGINMNPNSNAYHISSGIVDAVLNVTLDPTTWFGPGAVGKILTQGKKVTSISKGLQEEVQATNAFQMESLRKEAIDTLEKRGDITRDKLNKKISSSYKRFSTQYKKAEKEIIARETAIVDTQVGTFKKLLNTSKDIYAWEGVDKAADATLSSTALAKWFVQNPTVQTGELTKAIGLLSADMKNTGGFFDGFIIMDEVPRVGGISVGVHAAGSVADEYAVTLKAGKELNLLDMADTFVDASEEVRVAENLRRAKFADDLDKIARSKKDETQFRILTQLSTRIREDAANLDGFVGSLFSTGSELVGAMPLGTLIGEIAQYKNPAVMAQISDLVAKVWKVDGFTNIRSIYGQTGGVVVTNTKRLAAKGAEFGNAAAEILEPTNLGPNIVKLLDSVKGSKEEIARLENEINTLSNKAIDLKDKENWFNLLRENAQGDPDILKELIQDPANAGIKNLLKLELEVAESNVFRESLMHDIGITDNFFGEVLDTPAAEKALKFVLGRQFRPIAELIAKETSPVRLRRLFNRKLDDNMILELAAATNADEVSIAFLKQFSPEQDPNKIKQALSAGAKIATNPVARMVPGVNMDAIRYAENINKALGRFYIRTTALNLSDLTGLNNGVEDWMSSVSISRILGKNTQEKIITETQEAIFKSATPAERGKAVATGIGKMMEEVGRTLGLKEDELLELKNVARVNGKEEALIKSYFSDLSINNAGGAVFKAGDKNIKLEGGIFEYQLASDIINLPDSRRVAEAVLKHKTNLPIFGNAKSARILLEETNDLWRTAQLVFRVSYVFRNIAEMQMRQFFSGHNSLFNNPIGFISMVMATPEGNTFQKALAKRSKYGVNALGDWVKSTDAEVELSQSIIARRGLMRGTSVGDYGSSGRKANIFKAYQAVGTEHPDFLKGLAWTVNSYSADRFFPDVIRVLEKGTPEAKTEYVDNLIATLDEPGNKLKEFISAIYDDNEGMREILLKNPGLETGPGIVKENINKDNILLWLFDETQPTSYAGQLNIVAGQGAQRNAILDLIRDGESTITATNGKAVKIKTPYRIKGLTTEQVLAAEKSYNAQVAGIFKPEQLTGSMVTNVVEKSFGEGTVGKGKEFIDRFFNWAAVKESKYNFGPEFDASYWDYIIGYADMLDTPELKTLLRNANKALAPNSKIVSGKIIGRVPRALNDLNKIVKKRLANPDYVHVGGATLRTLDGIAGEQASNYVKNLFYDAAKQKQWANAVRIVAPFAQAHYNTISKWSELMKANPVPAYKFAKTFDALTKEGTNVIYETSNMAYDDNKGFIYKDDQTNQLKFKMPLVGNFLGTLAGRSINAKDAVQMTSPVEALNLAFGSVNPVLPGFGPAMVVAYQASGRSSAFGPVDDIVRDILTPFGEPKTPGDLLFPAWLKKTFVSFQGNDATTLRNVKDFASYLASTGEYGGDQALINDAERTRLFNDATKMAKAFGLVNALFTSISPSVPMPEVLASIKNPDNKQNFMTISMLYEQLQKLKDRYPSDQGVAIAKFAEQFGANNLLVAVSGTTPGTSGKADAWTFLNNNPGASDKYARPNEDVIPFFFPGGEYSQKYYNWQVKSGARRKLSTAEIMQESENMVYAMLKSQIAEAQIAGFYTGDWYVEQVAKLNKQFGGKPVDSLVTGISDARVATIERALQDPALQASPVYKQVSEFYPEFKKMRDLLNTLKVSNYAELSSKGGLPTLLRNELTSLGEKLMTENPDFIPMYYGVFAGILKESK